MLAYSNPIITRTKFLEEIANHQEQDKIIRGAYWDWNEDRGCAIGCAFSSIANISDKLMVPDTRDNHRLLARYLGIDEELLRVEDFLFENISIERAKAWPLEFSSAIQERADTSRIVLLLVAAVLRNLYAPEHATTPELATMGRRIADGIDAEWTVGQWLYLRADFPETTDWNPPYRAVNYILAKLRGETFVRNDALSDFLYHMAYVRDGSEWMANALLVLLRDAPIGLAEAA